MDAWRKEMRGEEAVVIRELDIFPSLGTTHELIPWLIAGSVHPFPSMFVIRYQSEFVLLEVNSILPQSSIDQNLNRLQMRNQTMLMGNIMHNIKSHLNSNNTPRSSRYDAGKACQNMDQNLAPPTTVGVHSTAHRGQMDVAFKVRATFFSGIGSVGFTNSVKNQYQHG
jgi:hypothetical protein